MTLSLFDQFAAPQLMGVSLIVVAMLLPALFLTPQTRLLPNRTTTLALKLIRLCTKQLMTPLNPPGHRWALPLAATTFFLLALNLWGLLPYTFTPTTQLAVSLGLAMPLWLTTALMGFRTQPTISIGHLLPPSTPPLLIPALVTIESVSLLIRPLALGVRLTANLTAGHLLMQLIATATLVLLTHTPALALPILAVLLLLTILELAVAIIQAYVFVLLISLYLQENI